MSVNSKMTAIADEVRELSGTTEAMGLDTMANTLHTENANFASNLTTQDSLIAQIQAALEGKAGGTTVVEPTLQEKTVTPTTSSQSVTPDSGYDGLSKVTVNAMPTATQATPSISISSSGLITASATQTAGYVTAGTKSGTKQLTTQAAKTITPNTTTQTAVNSGVYTTGAIKVNPIPSNYIVPSGTKTITTNGRYDVKDYAVAIVTVASTGEYVAAETEAYTSKLASLETAITALETELQGKTSGGSGGGVSIKTCTAIVNINLFADGEIFYNCYVDNNIMNDGALLNPMSATEFNNIIVGSMIILSFSNLVSVTCTGGEVYRKTMDSTTFIKVSVNSADGVIIDINSNSDNPFG